MAKARLTEKTGARGESIRSFIPNLFRSKPAEGFFFVGEKLGGRDVESLGQGNQLVFTKHANPHLDVVDHFPAGIPAVPLASGRKFSLR